MLQVIMNEEKKSTTAILRGTSTDALEKIGRRIVSTHPETMCLDDSLDKKSMYTQVALNSLPNGFEAIMPDKIVGTVRCSEEDTFDEEVGRKEAIKKATEKHNKTFKKAIIRWQAAMIKDIINVSPETFDEAFSKVKDCKHKCK